MRRAWMFVVLAMLGGFAGCQACCDETDYSSPVATTGPVDYSGTPVYSANGPLPQGAVVVPEQTAVVPQSNGGSGSY